MHFNSILTVAALTAGAFAAPAYRQACADVTVIFGRGSIEPPTIGILVGPGLQRDTAAAIGPQTLNFQGVPYPALLSDAMAGGSKEGTATLARMLAETVSACPNTKIVLSGYSQGAQLIHNAAASLITQDQADHVAAVVMFGDPFNAQPLGKGLDSKSRTFCNEGDNICDGGSQILPPHLAYGADTDEAAVFIAERV